MLLPYHPYVDQTPVQVRSTRVKNIHNMVVKNLNRIEGQGEKTREINEIREDPKA